MNRQQRRHPEHPMIVRIRTKLGLRPDRHYKLGLIRVSTRGAILKLQDNEDTGIAVYAENPDFQSLASLPADPRERGWMAIRYSDFHPDAPNSVFGWVGLVGDTIMLAVPDSAAIANLPPDPGDVAGIGRNAFVDLVVAAAYAGQVRDIYVPFRSRWWRHDLWANYLMEAINKGLPNCRLWEGDKLVATKGSGKLLTDVEGHQSTNYRETFLKQVFEKGVTHLQKGDEWDRPEHEMALGLRRKRIVVGADRVKLGLKVEEDPRWRPVAVSALEMRAAGKSWDRVGEYFAEKRVPMPGTSGVGKTFADYANPGSRTSGAKKLILNHLQYYEHREFVCRRTTDLTLDEIDGRDLEYDPATGRRYLDTDIKNYPHRPFLTPAQWAMFHKHQAEDDKKEAEATRSRLTGAAARALARNGRVSAFQGVSSWKEQDGSEGVMVPDSRTAYRWLTRPYSDSAGGWSSHENIEATLYRKAFDHACGTAFRDTLRQIKEPLKPSGRKKDDPVGRLEARVAELETGVRKAKRASDRADKELESTEKDDDDPEVAHWQQRGRDARARGRALAAELDGARAALAAVTVVEEIETEYADFTEPVLAASLMCDGDGWVDPLVHQCLKDYGVMRTLRLRRDQSDPKYVVASAVATLETLEGSMIEVHFSWRCEDSHGCIVTAQMSTEMARMWAAGATLTEITERYPDDVTPERVSRVLRRRFLAEGRGHIAEGGLRTAAVECPLTPTRSILAARLLDEPGLAATYADVLVRQIGEAYFSGRTRRGVWCDGELVTDIRRILVVFVGRPKLWDDGLDVDSLARLSGVAQAKIFRIARLLGVLEKVGRRLRLRPRKCTHAECATHPALTAYVPAPEAGNGLVCPGCFRADGLDAVLGEAYVLPWRRGADGSYEIDSFAVLGGLGEEPQILLSIYEAAAKLGLPPHLLRKLDSENALVPAERTARGGRRYNPTQLEAVPEEQLAYWRTRTSHVGAASDRSPTPGRGPAKGARVRGAETQSRSHPPSGGGTT
jgi:hypothetical protein